MGWFTSPKCSVESDAKNWIEDNFQWFIEEFGAERLKSVEVILPTDEFFPDKYSTRHEDVRKLLDRVCSYIGVNVGRVSLRFFTSEREKWKKRLPHLEFSDEGAVGTYKGWRGKHIVSIESSQLNNPSSVIAIMSHELGHALLIGENRIGGDEEDHEPLTEFTDGLFRTGNFYGKQLSEFSPMD